MKVQLQHPLSPRAVAQARRMRARVIGRIARKAWRGFRYRIAAIYARWSLARQYRRDLAMLMHADARMLADIGLTRGDVRAAASEGDFSRTLKASAERRDEAIAAAQTRGQTLPRVHAPALAPARIEEMANAK
jgi:uncharacterized protein YjiS (DUF1127 family)